MSTRVVTGIVTFLLATPALAATDLHVEVPAPSPAYVYDTTTFDVSVANTGNKRANNVSLTIELPETNTSPQVYVMGTLGGIDPRCSQTGTTLVCNLGNIARDTATIVSFDIDLPLADEALAITATATTTSAESNLSNNSATAEAVLLTYDVSVSPGDSAHNRHCTGQGLSSFFECLLFPSSISSHDIEFLADGELAFVGQVGYGGSWSQPTADTLTLTYEEIGVGVVAEFIGYGTNANCFEGITTFPGSPYISPYEVCI